MRRRLSIDLETFSSVDIKKSGAHAYVRSPDFQILLCAYSLDGGDVKILDYTDDTFTLEMDLLFALLLSEDVEKCAYNAVFEWLCLSKYFKVDLPISQWSCTMVHGLYLGYPAGLAAIGEALGLPTDKRKMGVGLSLIRTFCVPRKPTKTDARTRVLPHHEPEKWAKFKEYCKQDVRTEMAVKSFLDPYPVPAKEHELWCLDTVINARGVGIDRQLVAGALYVSGTVAEELMAEAKQITGLDNPKSVKQLTEWLEKELDEEVENLQKGTVTDMLARLGEGSASRMLQIRQELSKTSVKKYDAMNNVMCADDRARGLLQFYGANRTGRFAGRLVQVQNLPRNHMDGLEMAREFVRAGDVDMVKLVFGNVPDTLSQLIRTAFIPSDNRRFVVADFSAIEARVIAWLAGEAWRLEVFATHGKIYEASASAMFNVPIEKIKKGNPEYELRQRGKIAELALGYQGSVGALKKMGAEKMGLSEEDMEDIKNRWRASNKRIVAMWYACENAALAVMETGIPQSAAKCIFHRDDRFFRITLPSGRDLSYPSPALKPGTFGKMQLCYMGVDQNTKKWSEIPTYGGKLVENIVQAIARDCLAVSLVRAERAGFPVVMHVHDEIIADCTPDKTLEGLIEVMTAPIPWAEGLRLSAAGFEASFYQKD